MVLDSGPFALLPGLAEPEGVAVRESEEGLVPYDMDRDELEGGCDETEALELVGPEYVVDVPGSIDT